MKLGIQQKNLRDSPRFWVPLSLFVSFSGKWQRRVNKSSAQGLTLLETLVGILVITLVLAASTPPILLATATRIQNKKAEQAMQIAQQELDRVRLMVERGEYINSDLPPPAYDITSPLNIKNVASPNAVCQYPCIPDGPTEAMDRGDFIVQIFRDPGVSDPQVDDREGNDQVIAFRMGVRVYSSAAKDNLLDGLETEVASLQMGNSLEKLGKRPLAALYTDFARGDLTPSLRRYREFLQK
jgi:type II secretory pathway pseudopilin PulG